jgi:hypothetical protein
MATQFVTGVLNAIETKNKAETSAQRAIVEMTKGLAGALSAVKPDSKGKRVLECQDARDFAEGIMEKAADGGDVKLYRDTVSNMLRRAAGELELGYRIGLSFSVKAPEKACFTVITPKEGEGDEPSDAMITLAQALLALAGGSRSMAAKALALAASAEGECSTADLQAALEEFAAL